MKIKIDKNLPSNEYFPKSIVTKPKNDQGKSYSDRIDRETDRETDIENYNIDCNFNHLSIDNRREAAANGSLAF